MNGMRGDAIRAQRWPHLLFYCLFGLSSLLIMLYYLSDTLFHFTTSQQFPINSFARFPLTLVIFPAEVFSFLFGLYFVYNLLRDRTREPVPAPLPARMRGPVAILLPVYNEPTEIVERTLRACARLRWREGVRIYLLDDSTDEAHMRAMRSLARRFNCKLVRREGREGYKAGNVNNALKNAVKEEYFAILDSDQAPDPSFLEETMDHFSDGKVAFVQTPQHFVNDSTPLERTAKVGADIFFRTMCMSRSVDGAMVFCGTNAVIRADAFREVGGLAYYSSTEDIELGLRFNEAGYRGVYVPKVLVRGYAPRDFTAYASQQYRWSNGNLAILRESWFSILTGPYTLRQQVHYLFVLGWWLIGIVTLVYILVPIVSLLFGLGTHHTWLPTALLAWLYFHVVLGVGMIYVSLKGRMRGEKVSIVDALLQYSLLTNSAFIYARSALNAMLGRYVGFVRTSKRASSSGLWHIKWNLLLSLLCLCASAFALFNAARAVDTQQMRTYLPISLWLLFYALILASSILFVGKAKAEGATRGQRGAALAAEDDS